MQSLKAFARWVAVIPGALIAALLVSFPVRWIAATYQLLPDFGNAVLTDEVGRSVLKMMPLDDLERLGMATVAPATMILAAAFIAPRFKLATAIVVAVGISIFVVLALRYVRNSQTFELIDGPAPMWVMYALWSGSVLAGLWVAKSKFGSQPNEGV